MFIFLSSVILGRGEHRRINVISLLLLFLLDHTTCLFLAWLFCTGNKHVEHIFDMICLGQNRAFLHRGLGFSGYLVYLQMLPFCILQRVSKHCVAMLILLNLHWQAALMVFFYVFVWLFLVSMATDCTWWQATGRYDVNLGLLSFCLIFPLTLYSNLTLR